MISNKQGNGFSLAEILITVAVVGIVAAMTIPQLTDTIQKKEAGIALGKAVYQVETGCRNIISVANERLTDGTYFTGIGEIVQTDIGGSSNSLVYTDLFSYAPSFFGVEPVSDTSYNSKIKPYSSGQDANWKEYVSQATFYVDTKMNVYMSTEDSDVSGKVSSSDISDPIVSLIVFDVNGKNNPNRFGKDVFLFGLTDRCNMIPAGTAAFANLAEQHKVPENACQDGNITSGLSCTARVVEDGFKIKY